MRPAVTLLFGLMLSLGVPGLVAGEAGRPERPNIIIILADDLGYGDLGVQGGRDVATPNIDRLAAEGVRFTDFYAGHPVCAPSRASLMTGRYQHRFGFENNPGMGQRADVGFGLPRQPGILPERLKARGYATAMVGKWHLGFTPQNTPAGRGFDLCYGFLDGAMAYLADAPSGSKSMMRGQGPAPMPAHTTEAFTQEAVQFIDANRDRPFFIYAAYNAVHAPLQSTDPYLARFADVKDPKRRAYLAMLAALDDGVGEITAAVDRNGLAGKTLIVFTSDNGGPTWQTTSANGPLNGVKATVLEGGIRVPAIFRWPGTIPAGKTSSAVAMEFDLSATALALAGEPPSADLDGLNLMPFLAGDRSGDVHSSLYWRSGAQGAVRSGPWKMVKAEDQFYLFDLRSDLGEHHDLAASNPARLKTLKGEWQAWSDAMMPAKWGPLNATGSANPGEVKALIGDYVAGRAVDPRRLLYGGGPE